MNVSLNLAERSKMKLSIAFGIFLSSLMITSALPFSSNGVDDWTSFKVKYGRTYESQEEENLRMKIFEDNKIRVEEHNRLHAAGLKSYSVEINKFSDRTENELKEMTGYRRSSRVPYSEHSTVYEPSKSSDLPAEVDWRTKGAVTGVKDQQVNKCGSCWAFSAVASLEGQNFLTNGKLVSLSEQNLVDCEKKDFGCQGGQTYNAYNYIIKNKGIDTEDSYKYEAHDGACRFQRSSVGAVISGYIDIPVGNETALQAAVAHEGPIAVCINTPDSFWSYKEGIYYSEDCVSFPEELNHCVTVVGYGTEDNQDYWLVKNSCGENWGDKGYIKMARNKENSCGISTDARYPLVVKT